MPGQAVDKSLPEKVAKAVSGKIYRYDSRIEQLSEADLLVLCDLLTPYYPPTEEETTASVALREWFMAKEVRKTSGEPVDGLLRSMQDVVNAWGRIAEEALMRGHREHRYREERYPETHPDYLHKKIYQGMRSGDVDAMMAAIGRLVEEAVKRSGSQLARMPPPPPVVIPPELVAAAKEFAEKTDERLIGYIDRVAKAKQCLARYVYRIVAAEGIEPTGK